MPAETPEQHYARGMELLAESEKCPSPTGRALWLAQRATAHFAAATVLTQQRALQEATRLVYGEQAAAGESPEGA